MISSSGGNRRSEVGSLRRLGQLLVCGRGHESRACLDTKAVTMDRQSSPSDLNQDGLHGEIAFPLAEAGELGKIDLIMSLQH